MLVTSYFEKPSRNPPVQILGLILRLIGLTIKRLGRSICPSSVVFPKICFLEKELNLVFCDF